MIPMKSLKISLVKNAASCPKPIRKSILKSLFISSSCIFLIIFQLFFPHLYYSSISGGSGSGFSVGIHYAYDQDNISKIYDEVSRIHDLGFKVIKTYLQCDPFNENAIVNQQTDVFLNATSSFGIPVA